MDPRLKNYWGWVGLLALVVLTVAGIQAVLAYSRSVPPAASFTVSGEGKVVAAPDTAELTFGVSTDGGKNVSVTQASNTDKMNSILDFVKSEGVDPQDIQTVSYSISPRYQYYSCPPQPVGGTVVRPCPPSEVTGYTVSQTVTAKVRDFSKIGEILSGLASRGATNVSGPNFTLHDKTAVENQARAEAITEAKSKAEAFAKAGGFGLGRILSIEESNSNPPIYAYKALGMGGAAEAAPAPVISPGSEEIVKDVTITYEIN